MIAEVVSILKTDPHRMVIRSAANVIRNIAKHDDPERNRQLIKMGAFEPFVTAAISDDCVFDTASLLIKHMSPAERQSAHRCVSTIAGDLVPVAGPI